MIVKQNFYQRNWLCAGKRREDDRCPVHSGLTFRLLFDILHIRKFILLKFLLFGYQLAIRMRKFLQNQMKEA